MAGNTKRHSKSHPTWTDVKAKLTDFGRPALLGLIQSLYRAHKDNQMFLHSRFGLGGEVLEPYKKSIDRWLWPDVLRRQDTSVPQAKQAISDYKRAVGDPEGVAELMVFYCEQAAGFCSDICTDVVRSSWDPLWRCPPADGRASGIGQELGSKFPRA
jgi:hypothetical protein